MNTLHVDELRSTRDMLILQLQEDRAILEAALKVESFAALMDLPFNKAELHKAEADETATLVELYQVMDKIWKLGSPFV